MGLLVSCASALVLVGCGDSSGTTGSGGGGTGGNGTGGTTTSVTVTSTTSTGGGTTGDGNDSFEEAVALDAMGNQDILDDPSKDADFFTFEGTAGDAFLIFASSHPSGTESDPGYVDTFVELYDSNKTLLATNDDGYPRSSTDSQIITILPTTGTYYLKIQDWCISPTKSDMFCDQAYFDSLVGTDYVIGAIKIDEGPGSVFESEPNDTGATASPVIYAPTTTAGSYYLTTMAGTMPMAADADWYAFTVPADLAFDATSRAKTGFLFPWGATTGNGSNLKVGKVDVIDQNTMAVISSFDMTGEPADPFARAELQLPVTAGGSYYLKVTHGGAEATGQGNFYFVYETVGGGNPLELNDVTNNLPATPDVLPLATGTTGSYFVEGNLTAADADYFQIAANGQATISIACGSQRQGSGLRGFKATVFKADGITPVAGAAATETATTDLFLDHVSIPAGEANLVVKIEATLPADATNTGNYYICGFHAGPPAN